MARLLIGVSGGIAAYKALELVRLATKAGHAVRAIQTPASRRFVGEASLAGLTGAPVLVGEFERDPARGAFPGDPLPEHEPISHLALVENADAYLIAPATANTLAKLAGGHADGLLTSAALAATCPVLIAPAMNHHMWLHPATQANVETLRARGVTVIGPGEGELASKGEHGLGRLAEPPELLAAVEAALAPGDLAGLHVLVTAGGTREPIDAVRFLGNRSSGRMGYALAERAARRGAQVTVVAANVALPDPPGVAVRRVQTAAELGAACAEAFGAADVLLMAAAVADFRPARPVTGKIKKDSPDAPASLELEPTEDVLAGLSAARRPAQTLVGFAAEHGDGAVEYGRGKLERKDLDLVVVNDTSEPGIAFDAIENAVTILARDGSQTEVARADKVRVADAILDAVRSHRNPTETHGADRAAAQGRAARV
jgi:phosphopantothenoylcysteine decarboxylase / phosphopantothenate---cysteine ligase